jgi:succinoglycan biosynthesis transport protein ExoP
LQTVIAAPSAESQPPAWNLRTGVRALLRHKRMIGTAVLLGLVIAVIVRLQIISRYEAEAQVVLDVRSTHILKFDAVLSGLPTLPEVLHTEMDVINSSAMAGRVLDHLSPADVQKLAATTSLVTPLARMLGDGWNTVIDRVRAWLPTAAQTLLGAPGTTRAVKRPDSLTREDLVQLIMSGLKVSNDSHSYTIHISFTSADPQLAATMANGFAREYLASQLDRKIEATQHATTWLSGRLVELRRELEASEVALERYRRATGVVDTKGSTLAMQEFGEVSGQLVAARAQQIDAESRLNAVRALAQGGGNLEGLGDVLSSGVVQQLRMKQAELKRQEAEYKGQYTSKYPGLTKLQTDLVMLQRQINEETNRIIANLSNQADIARTKVGVLSGKLAMLQQKLGGGGEAEVKLLQLQREADANRSVYETYLNRYKETSEQETLQEADAYQISTAIAPKLASYPRTRPLLLLGMIFGGLLGAGAALLRETLDQRLRSVGQVEAATGLPVLALLPSVPSRIRPEEYVLRRPWSLFNEALRSTWAALSLSPDGPIGKVVVITSSVPDEGKTAYGLSLARSLASDGHRVLLIDGDLRRPGVAGSLGPSKDGRLGDLLAGRIGLQEAIETDEQSGADYIGSQSHDRHPQDLLSSRRMMLLLDEARALYDVVIVDTPPILVAADAALVAKYADRCLFFIRWGATSREHVASALNRLALYNVRISGVVLSHVNMRQHASYAAGEGYYRAYGPRQRLLPAARSS